MKHLVLQLPDPEGFLGLYPASIITEAAQYLLDQLPPNCLAEMLNGKGVVDIRRQCSPSDMRTGETAFLTASATI